MRRYLALSLLAATCATATAVDGHNGVRFDMRQKQVEALGFVCVPEEKPTDSSTAECRHMDMTGSAFGLPTRDYVVYLDRTGKVSGVSARFADSVTTPDYLELHSKIIHFFPDKSEQGTVHSQSAGIRRDEWHAKNGAAVVLLLSSGVRPITRTTLSITFWAPTYVGKSLKRAE